MPSDRQLSLLGKPTKEQTLALVGWLALSNAFGPVAADISFDGHGLPTHATRWVGELMAVAGRGHRKPIAQTQQTIPNRRRKVKARKNKVGLATGPHC